MGSYVLMSSASYLAAILPHLLTRQEEHYLWPVQVERLAGLCHVLCRLWVYAGLVCHLLVPVRLASECAIYELRLSNLGRLDHLPRGMVVYRSAHQLRRPNRDWRHISGRADSTGERGVEEEIDSGTNRNVVESR